MKYIWPILLVFIVFTGCAIVKIPLFPSPQGLEEQVLEGEGNAKILLLDISDVISDKKKAGGIGFRQRASLVARI